MVTDSRWTNPLTSTQQELLKRIGNPENTRNRVISFPPGGMKSAPAIVQCTTGPVLLVCPGFLIDNWCRYIEEWCPDYTYARVDSDKQVERIAAIDREAHFTVMSYNMLALATDTVRADGTVVPTPYGKILSQKYTHVIFDEAHRLRGRNSKWTKNAYRLKTDKFTFLTGSLFVSNPGNIFPILKLLDPKVWTSYWRFVETYCIVEPTPWDKIIKGIRPGMMERWQTEVLDPYVIHKEEWEIPELASIDYVEMPPIVVDMPPSVVKTFRTAKRDWVLEHPDIDEPEAIESAGKLIPILRKLSSLPPTQENPKLKTLRDILSDFEDEQALVFCWYVEVAEYLAKGLKSLNRPITVCTGLVSGQQRSQSLEVHRKTKDGIVIATIESLKEGENLQTGRLVVFYEEDYLPDSRKQAIGRVKRGGQNRTVYVYSIHGKHMLDAGIHRVMQQREHTNNRAIRGLLYETETD